MADVEVTLLDQHGKPMADGGYDGASRTSQALGLYHPPILSADQAVNGAKGAADPRVQDMIRNDAYLQGGVNIHRDSIVGSHYLLNAKPKFKVLGLDEAWADEFQEEVETKFTLYGESLDNWIDASRQCTFTGLVRLATAGFTIAGESLATMEWMRGGVRPFRTAVQMVDPDRLSNPNFGPDEPSLRRGIEKDRFGAPVAYHFRVQHPGELYMRGGTQYSWRRVPIRKPWGRLQVLHHYEPMRPDQSRGIAGLVSALKECRMTQRFRDVTLQNAVLQASYAATIESELPPEAAYAALGMNDAQKWALDYLSAISAYSGSSRNMHVDGAKFTHLYPGTKLRVQPVGSQGGMGDNFEQSLLRYVAGALDVSYEELSRDYTNTNYSSARAAMRTTELAMKSRKKMGADRFASAVFRCWLEEAIMSGQIESLPRNAPAFHEGQNADAYASCTWIGASRGQIDELKETQAAVLRLNNNLGTQEAELARLGLDWREVLRQRAKEKKMMDDLGLVTAVDPMMNSVSGSAERDTEKNT